METRLLRRPRAITPDESVAARENSARQGKPQSQPRRRRPRQWLRENGSFLLMATPGILVLLVFSYLPMIGLIIAFKDYLGYQGIFGSAWVGLQNFQFLFGTPDALQSMSNTLVLNAIFILTTQVAALAVALLLNEIRDRSRWLSNFYQSTLFFPFFMSWVIVAYFVFALLSDDTGLVNQLLAHFGMSPISWYESAQYWPAILTLINLWKNIGFYVIIYLAAILAITPEYYEAASLDGASKLKQVQHITLPFLAPVIIINFLLSIGRIFYADFGLFFQVTRNSPLLYPTTSVIDTYVYRALVNTNDISLAAAASFFQAIVGFLLVLIANWFVRRMDKEKALF